MKKMLLFLLFLFIVHLSAQEAKNKETIHSKIIYKDAKIKTDLKEINRLCDSVEFDKQHINIGDIDLYCEIEGEGIPIVLVHGGPGGTHNFFHPSFENASKFSKVIYYDERGCGLSDYVEGDGYSFEQMVDDLDKLRKALKIEKWVVLGHSFGGVVAQFYTIKYPENVSGLVLVGSVSLMPEVTLMPSRRNTLDSENETKLRREARQLFTEQKISFEDYWYNDLIYGGWRNYWYYKPNEEIMLRFAKHWLKADPQFGRALGSDYVKYNFEKVFVNSPLPTLLMEGKWDLIWNVDKADKFKKLFSNVTLKEFEFSGHEIFDDEPKKFFYELENFVSTLKSVDESSIVAWKKETAQILNPQKIKIANDEMFLKMIENDGVEKAIQHYKSEIKKTPNKKLFFEASLNRLGYNYLVQQKYDQAIKIMELNTIAYPDSWNVYDSLADAYNRAGYKKKAIENFEISVAKNPENQNAKDYIKRLKDELKE